MAINFPSNPSDGDIHNEKGRRWIYNSASGAWKSVINSTTIDTDTLVEGTQLFYTDARVKTKLGSVSDHIIPDTDITYDLGSATNRFRDLYLSGNSIELGTKTITEDNIPEVDLAIAPEVLEIQVAAPAAGQDTAWLWTWEQSTLPYARRTITNSPEIQVPLYLQGTYVVNNYAAYDLFDSMTQTHSLYLKWVDGAGTDNLVSWATSTGPVSDSHPDINSGNATDVQRLSINVPSTITLPTLTAPSVSYSVVNNGAGAYTFSGAAKGDNPNIGPFYRGGTYTFTITASGHPLYLTTDNGTNFSAGTYFGEYTSGVTGSRTDSGTLTIVVPNDAPDTLYYQCGNHSAMRGAITVKNLEVETNNNGNYVIYFQHTQEGHKTPVELRPIPSLVNQMCLVYDASSGKFVPQDLATYVENTPSFENKIREVAGTAELVVEDGSAVVAKVNVYPDSTYLPLTGNNSGDQAFATDINKLFIWDGSAWQQAGSASTDELSEGSSNLYYTDARVDARLASGSIGNVIVGGDLTVNGTTTTLNSTTLAIDDKNIVLASGAPDAVSADGAGITIDGAVQDFIWNETAQGWQPSTGLYMSGDNRITFDSNNEFFIRRAYDTANRVLGTGTQTLGTFGHIYPGLQINGDSGSNRQIINFTDGAGDNTTFSILHSINSGATWSPVITVRQSGKVGINTSTPNTLFHVKSTGSEFDATIAGNLPSILGDGSYGAGFGLRDGSKTAGMYTTASGGRFNFFTGQTSLDRAIDKIAMTIDDGQKVGIGTTAPTQKLDVRGMISSRTANNISNIIISDDGAGNESTTTNRDAMIVSVPRVPTQKSVAMMHGRFEASANKINIGGMSTHSSGNWDGTGVQGATEINFYTVNAVDTETFSSTNPSMKIDNNGKVGISQQSPTYHMHIGSNAGGDTTDYGMYIERHGNGTTPGAWTNSMSAIRISDTASEGPSTVEGNSGVFVMGFGRMSPADTGAENASIINVVYDGQLGPLRLDGKGNLWTGYDRGAAEVNTNAWQGMFRGGITAGANSAYRTGNANGGALIQGNVGVGTTNPRHLYNNSTTLTVENNTNSQVAVLELNGNCNAIAGNVHGIISFMDNNVGSSHQAMVELRSYADGANRTDAGLKIRARDNGTLEDKIIMNSEGDFYPNTSNQNLGTTSNPWQNIYTGDLHLSNENHEKGNDIDGTKGNWTLQEGEEELYIINNKTGKKYAFALREIE